VNGIVGNEWWDRDRKKTMPSVIEENKGRSPMTLLVDSVGDILKMHNHFAKVISLSGKDRSAILMGGKKANIACWFDRTTGRFFTSRYYGESPDWLNQFNDKYQSSWLSRASRALLSRTKFSSVDPSDDLLFELATTAITVNRLGNDDHVDFLAVSFSSVDNQGHAHGPDSLQVKAQLMELDHILAELLTFLKSDPTRGEVDVVLTSDHGVMPVVESVAGKKMGARRISPRTLTGQIESKLQALRPVPGMRWVERLDPPHVYLNRDLAAPRDIKWEDFLQTAAVSIKSISGVAEVYGKTITAKDEFAAVYAESIHPQRSGDLLLRMQPGVLISGSSSGTSHGSPYDYDAHVPLIFWGPSIKPGRHENKVRLTDVAPTIASLFHIPFTPSSGSRVLVEALK
jgi:predicted AlkP superfamily pyrophosphatase or phosphodiesterase